MKHKLLSLILIFVICFAAFCGCDKVEKQKEVPQTEQIEEKYKLVKATKEDFDKIIYQLEPILAMYLDDYNYETENPYDNLFYFNVLDWVYPACEEEIEKYIAEPLEKDSNEYGTFRDWSEYVAENDPLGKFGTIPLGIYDETGCVDEYLAYELEGVNPYDVVIGYNKYSGEYIDFLVEGVWNGKVDHKTFFELENSRCYYYNGFYYTPEMVGDRGGPGIVYYLYLNSITALEDNKYRVEYVRYDDNHRYDSSAVAVLGLKETKDGFRFWSIYELEQDK